MIRTNGVFAVTGAVAGALVLTDMLMTGGAVSSTMAFFGGVIGGGAAGGVVGGLVDGALGATVGRLFFGGDHHRADVRKLQRASRKDGKAHTNLTAREAENQARLMAHEAEMEQRQNDWRERIREEAERSREFQRE